MIQNNVVFHKLKYWRGMLGITQENMATLTGQTKSNYCLKENGRITFKLCEMIIIKNAINEMLKNNGKPDIVTLDEIFLN